MFYSEKQTSVPPTHTFRVAFLLVRSTRVTLRGCRRALSPHLVHLQIKTGGTDIEKTDWLDSEFLFYDEKKLLRVKVETP